MGISSQSGNLTQLTQSAQTMGSRSSRDTIRKPKRWKNSGARVRRKISLNPMAPGLGQAGFNQAGGDALALVGRRHGHGPDFSQAGPADVQGGDAQEGALVLPVDVVIPQLAIEISQGPGQDAPILGKFRQEAADFRDFVYFSLANHFAAIGLRKDYDSVIIY